MEKREGTTRKDGEALCLGKQGEDIRTGRRGIHTTLNDYVWVHQNVHDSTVT